MSELFPERHLFIPPITVKPKTQETKTVKKTEEKTPEPEETKPVFDIPKDYQPNPLPKSAPLVVVQRKQPDVPVWRKILVAILACIIILSLGVYIFFA